MPTTNECPNNMESSLQSTNKSGSSKPTAADSAANTKPHIKNEDDEDDFTKVVMGGSIRGMLLFLFKKISLKAILKRKAFLTIGGTAEGGYDKDFVARKSVSSLSHSRPVGECVEMKHIDLDSPTCLTNLVNLPFLLLYSLRRNHHDGNCCVWYVRPDSQVLGTTERVQYWRNAGRYPCRSWRGRGSSTVILLDGMGKGFSSIQLDPQPSKILCSDDNAPCWWIRCPIRQLSRYTTISGAHRSAIHIRPRLFHL